MSKSLKILQILQNPLVVKQVCAKPVQTLQNIQVRTEYSWPGYGSRYGFTNWRMKKDYMKRKILTEKHIKRMRLNAVIKNTILPVELRVRFVILEIVLILTLTQEHNTLRDGLL
ncbi:uncharacterized protein LOC132712988 [Ruditapes philippinarum]|uniref:uncharacterized protein LOC132712988 n=1 Tax=Ruditapes philippinarum TaxID=129788 RepID=UPI00295B915A|nr:uncharacterized protein LOC132712988 [Ruditapes philippinarum]